MRGNDFLKHLLYILNCIGLKFISNFHIAFHLTENNIDFIDIQKSNCSARQILQTALGVSIFASLTGQ